MSNVRNSRWSRRAHLKSSSAPRDQHLQVRREDDKSNDTVEERIPQKSESDR
jgi:hypothetical protein